jgi:heptaprenyl diphosphate synthase
MATARSTHPAPMTPARLGALFGIDALPRRMTVIERRLASGVRRLGDVLTPTAKAAVGAKGKRLRPLLTVVCAELGGVFDDRVVNAAVAIELIQVGSLIHDDVIEDAPTRRGAPTVNAVDGVGTAVVTGDLVLSAAAALAAGLGAAPSEMLSQGLVDMATGQLNEMQDLFNAERTVERHMAATQAKTGALFSCACRLGAWCGGLPDSQQDAVTRYGGAFGVGYQLLDDLLDLIGDPARLGKPVGVDLKTGVYTLPTLLALRQRGGKTLARLLRRGGPDDLGEARDRIRASDAVDETIDVIGQWMTEAERAVRRLPESAVRNGLARFPQTYLSWGLDALAPNAGGRGS